MVLPPDYKEIPIPGSSENLKKKDDSEIKKILKATKDEKISNEKVSSTENSIIDKIRKWKKISCIWKTIFLKVILDKLI